MNPNRSRELEAGYTLTEMLVVIAVIGLIAAVLTPNLLNNLSRARAKAAQLQLKSVASAVVLFKDDVGRYPTPQEGLAALIRQPQGADSWTGPYLDDVKALNDPWDRPIAYILEAEGGPFHVASLGADGQPGGSGSNRDLISPERPR